jgi:hypothetical protein
MASTDPLQDHIREEAIKRITLAHRQARMPDSMLIELLEGDGISQTTMQDLLPVVQSAVRRALHAQVFMLIGACDVKPDALASIETPPDPMLVNLQLALDENDKLKAELQESDQLRDQLSFILEHTANALKGPPEPLSRHSWHDLAGVAAALVAENKALKESKP